MSLSKNNELKNYDKSRNVNAFESAVSMTTYCRYHGANDAQIIESGN
jgi:hypothetical protein